MNVMAKYLLAMTWAYFVSIATSDEMTADFILQRMINESYDARVRPPSDQQDGRGPVKVHANFYIRSLSNIDFVSMQYDLQVTFREKWKDGRLAYDYHDGQLPPHITITDKDLIWRPDTFFTNEKRAHRHEIDKPNILIRISPDGTVLFSERITLTLSCYMYLQRYPMDIQHCGLDLASYAYTTDDLRYEWFEKDPIQYHDRLHSSLPSFELTGVQNSYCNSKTTTGEYSCMRITFELSRQFSYYVLQVYIPSTLLVIVSWVSFWLDRSAVPARVTLGVTTLLTMTTQGSKVNSNEAETLLEKIRERQRKDTRRNFFLYTMFENADEAKLVDVKSRIIFPILFIVFNVIYWAIYYENRS